MGAAGRDQEAFLKQAKQFGLDKKMKIFQFLADIAFDDEMGYDVVAGTYGATNFLWTNKDAGTQKFVKDYTAEYGKPPSGYSAYVYNAVMLIAQQVKADLHRKILDRLDLEKLGRTPSDAAREEDRHHEGEHRGVDRAACAPYRPDGACDQEEQSAPEQSVTHEGRLLDEGLGIVAATLA